MIDWWCATGQLQLFRPDIPGLAEHGFSVDQLDDAIALDRHLHGLAERPALNGRDTVVVAGGGSHWRSKRRRKCPAGFVSAILGKDAKPRVIIVERNSAVAPDMGASPRPAIEEALRKLGVETRVGVGVTAIDESGVTLSNGEHIETETVIWAAGIRAAPLTAQIPAERDNLGRLLVDRGLARSWRGRRLRHRRCRQGSVRRCRQLRADVVPARDADGRLRRPQMLSLTSWGVPTRTVSPGGVRHLPGSRRSRRNLYARLGSPAQVRWRGSQEDQAADQYRVDLPAQG